MDDRSFISLDPCVDRASFMSNYCLHRGRTDVRTVLAEAMNFHVTRLLCVSLSHAPGYPCIKRLPSN